MDATESRIDPPPRASVGKWIAFAVFAAVVLVYVVIVTAPRRGTPGTEGPAIGQRLPHFHLEPLTGDAQPVALEDLDGRVSLLNFWGTWCGPCILEFPHLVALAESLRGQPDFRFYPVSCGQSFDENPHELRSETMAFLASRNVELTTYADPAADSRRGLTLVAGLDDFPGYPTTLVLDRQGRIRGLWVGYDPQAMEDIQRLVAELLAEKSGQSTAAF